MKIAGVLVAAVATAVAVVALAVPASAAGYVETHTANPVVAAPPPTRPATPSCAVRLATKFPSNAVDGTPQDYSGTLTPPAACPGPWAKVVLDQTISVSGRQFDRSSDLRIGQTEVYFGTTEEPSGPKPTIYHVSKDITEYSALLTSPQSYVGGIGNYTSDVYTGVYVQTVSITYFTATVAVPAPVTPDVVIGSPILDANVATIDDPYAPVVHLPLTNLPRNITRAVLEVTLKGNGCDEQWFDDVEADLVKRFPDGELCGHGPYREADVSLDNTPAGAVGTFPYIYSGGIVPTLWRPIPAIGTFDLTPETLDLTPFVGRLVDGQAHDLAISVDDIGDTWNVIPTLLLWTDHHRATTSGALTSAVVGGEASETISEKGVTGGRTETLSADRDDTTTGYVDTSAGRITTTVHRTRQFTNVDTLTDKGLTQHVQQSDTGMQEVDTRVNGRTTSTRSQWSYPLTVAASAAQYVDDQNFDLTGHVTMTRSLQTAVRNGATWQLTSFSTEVLDSTGELARTNGVNTTADGSSTSRFTGQDDAGHDYTHLLASQHGLITQNVVTP